MVVLSIFSPVTPRSKFAKMTYVDKNWKRDKFVTSTAILFIFCKIFIFPQPSFDLDKKNSTEVIELVKKRFIAVNVRSL